MPLRLPSRRRVESPEGAPFRRRTPPTPQATRLMRVSLGAGIALLVVLGVLFIPRGLQYGGEAPPVIDFVVVDQDPFVVQVQRASREYALANYRVELNLTQNDANRSCPCVNTAVLTLEANRTWGGVLGFSDADGDGMLSSGDTFMIQRQSGGPWRYLLLVFFKPRDAGAVAPCPCAAGRWEFPVP